MGYNLNRLMRQYGLATPTMAQYTGEMGPDVVTVDEETGETTTTPGTVTFDPVKQAAFDDYQDQYQFRLSNRPMYESAQFRTTPAQTQPQTYEDMFTMYLGRPRGDGETLSGPVNDAQRNEFLRIYENEFADLGINNTGNQLVADQIGNYYGNILRNPDFVSNVPTTPVDPSAPFIERNPTVVNPNPPFVIPPSGLITSAQATDDPNNPPVIYEDIIDEETGEVTGQTPVISDTFTAFGDQQDQILANLANPLPDESIMTIEDARNVDPFASSSSGLPSYGAYLAKNLDVFDDITGLLGGTPQPGYAALNVPVGGFVPGSPEALAVDQYVANAAKNHFVNHGFLEGRKFYETGGEVKGFQEAGPVREEELVEVSSDIGEQFQLNDGEILNETGLKVTIDGMGPPDPYVPDPTVQAQITELQNMRQDQIDRIEKSQLARDKSIAGLEAQQEEAIASYGAMMDRMAEQTGQGPAASEVYFNLASAFLQPTKTGSFGESLGLGAKVLSKYSKDKRSSILAKNKMLLDRASTKLNDIKAKLKSAKDLSATERNRLYTMQDELIKSSIEELREGQRLAEKANDKKEVRYFKQQKLKLEREEIEADKERNRIEDARYLKKEDEKRRTLSKYEGTLKFKETEKLNAYEGETGLINKLERAVDLSGKAEVDSKINAMFREGKSFFGVDLTQEQRDYVDLLQLINREAVKTLKETFGAQLSDSERKVFFSLQGVEGMADQKTRTRILKDILAEAKKGYADRQKMLKKINNREFRYADSTSFDGLT